ncbi:nuclear transport factor 2 family protein [Thermodesulfobacteriota bacterium]
MIGVWIAKKKITSAFKALNSHDAAAFTAAWADDCTFYFPGTTSVSGKMEGRAAIDEWFVNQFPKVEFRIRNICVENIFDFVGTNVVAVHWELTYTNRDGTEVENSGCTLINVKFGKATLVYDYFFDTHEKLNIAWGEV